LDKKHIVFLCILVALLAMFFQFSRMDGFLHMYSVKKNALSKVAVDEVLSSIDENERDQYLIIYDPHDVASVFMRHRMQWLLKQKKKACVSAAIWDDIELKPEYRGVLVATGHIDKILSWDKVISYVEEGGSAVVLSKLDTPRETEGNSLANLYPLGVRELGGDLNTTGLSLQTDFMIGGKGFEIPEGKAYQTDTTKVELSAEAQVHVRSAEGEPLLWENHAGEGRFYVYNGALRDDKTNVGIMTSHRHILSCI
jgi:hypothetical protein